MKQLLRTLIFVAVAALGLQMTSCDEPEPTPQPKPTVAIEAGEATDTTLSFTITSENADKVKYLCATEQCTATHIFNNGIEAPGGTANITANGLTPDTAYTIYAIAISGEVLSEPATAQMKTLASPEPSVSLQAGEATSTTLSFTVTSSNAQEVRYVAIDELTLPTVDVTADYILKSDYTAEPNTSSLVTVEYLIPNTKYYIYAIATLGTRNHISAPLEMTTLEPTYTSTELPTPDFCTANLSIGSNADKYEFALSDEAGRLYLTFSLYTEVGTNGAIPTATYPLGSNDPGEIALGSVTLVADDVTFAVVSGSLDVELYDQSRVRIAGGFTLEDGNQLTLSYDGDITIMGISVGDEEASVHNVTFVSVANIYTLDDAPGWFEIQLTAEDGSMLDLVINSNPEQKHLTSGFYPTFNSPQDAQSMAMGSSWTSTASFYQDASGLPYAVLPGLDSYIQVSTDMDNSEPVDNYSITIALKVKSHATQKDILLNGTYNGPLGFEAEAHLPTLEIATFYVEIISKGNQHILNFYGMFTDLTIKIVAESLAEIGGDYVYHDIVGGSVSDMYAGVSGLPIDGGRIAIKRFEDTPDASDEDRLKPYYGFRLEGVTAKGGAYRVVGDWTSYEQAK